MADPREPLGRIVHEIRLASEAGRAAAEGRQRFNLPPWEERAPEQQELDMRIGEAVAAAERERIATAILEYAGPGVPGVERDVLELAARIARGGQGQERSDDKEADRG